MTIIEQTPYRDSDVLFNLLESVEHAVALSLTCHSRTVYGWRRIIGWAEPPNDCCPEIAVWGGNLRPDPAGTIQNGGLMRASCSQTWLYDVTIRVSQCFIDADEKGEPLEPSQINDYSRELYSMQHDMYNGFWCRWVNGQIDEIKGCTPIMLGNTTEYAEGGCGGSQFTVTVRLGVD